MIAAKFFFELNGSDFDFSDSEYVEMARKFSKNQLTADEAYLEYVLKKKKENKL